MTSAVYKIKIFLLFGVFCSANIALFAETQQTQQAEERPYRSFFYEELLDISSETKADDLQEKTTRPKKENSAPVFPPVKRSEIIKTDVVQISPGVLKIGLIVVAVLFVLICCFIYRKQCSYYFSKRRYAGVVFQLLFYRIVFQNYLQKERFWQLLRCYLQLPEQADAMEIAAVLPKYCSKIRKYLEIKNESYRIS